MDICTTCIGINCIFAPAQYWVLYLLTFPRFSGDVSWGWGSMEAALGKRSLTSF